MSASKSTGGAAKAPRRPALPTVTPQAAELAREEIAQRKFSPSPTRPPAEYYPDPQHIVILDTGAEAAVVGMAIASALNYLYAERGNRQLFSAHMLYAFARLYDEFPGTDYEGSSLVGGLAGLMQAGVCLDKDWPASRRQPSKQILENARKHRPHAVLQVDNTADALRAAIFEYHAVLVSAGIHDGWQRPEHGVIPFVEQGNLLGGSAFLLLGYTAQGYIVQNCWGANWGGLKIGDSHLGGLAIWTYEDAARHLGDAWVIQLTRPVNRVPLVGYDTDALDGDDLLDISDEVNAFSYVLASRAIKPPLALGLFGDWGSGKSFFMQEMHGKIESLAALARRQRQAGDGSGQSPFCSNIVQIRFNAWHYLDANLWASLVTEIFDKLFAGVGGGSDKPEARMPKLAAELESAQGVYQQAKRQLADAEQERANAETALQKATEAREQKEASLKTRLDDLTALLASDPDLRTQLQQLATDLGLPRLSQSYAELEARTQEIGAMGQRFQAILQTMFATPWGRGRTLTLVAALLAPVLVALAIEMVQAAAHIQLQAFHSFAVQVSGLLAALTAWLGAQARRGNNLLTRLQDSHQQLERIRRQRRDSAVAEEENALQALREKEAAARRSVKASELHLQTLQREIQELQPGRLIMRFIEERSKSGDYRSRLGIVSLVRRDFERLSELSDPASARHDASLMPVERIILYIDDLDRCRPERVIEVLEAVHLLLAFRLFMVVVAVDPRWLRRCLEKHYPDLLTPGSHDVVAGARGISLRPATAQDYLEKIFQIPFALQPLHEDGYRRLIQGLTELNRAPPTPAGTAAKGKTADAAASEPGVDNGDPSAASLKATQVRQSRQEAVKKTARAELRRQAADEDDADSQVSAVQRLELRPRELKDMERLAALFHTPRSVKRFVNTYRFLRASVRPRYLAHFDGTADNPGSHRAAMTLLAIVISHANVAPRLLRLLADLDENREATPWLDFLADARGMAVAGATAATASSAVSARNPPAPANLAAALPQADSPGGEQWTASADPQRTWQELDWQQLCDNLLALSDGGFPVRQAGELKAWIGSVSRFSFSLAALATLDQRTHDKRDHPRNPDQSTADQQDATPDAGN